MQTTETYSIWDEAFSKFHKPNRYLNEGYRSLLKYTNLILTNLLNLVQLVLAQKQYSADASNLVGFLDLMLGKYRRTVFNQIRNRLTNMRF